MMRLFIDYDGDMLAHEEWKPKPIDSCFWCGTPLLLVNDTPCYKSQGLTHDFVTVCERGRDGTTSQ